MWRWIVAGFLMLLGTVQAVAGFDEAVAAANDGKFAEAFEAFSALAEQDDARAQQALAWMYYEGQGRKRDYEKAAYWYRKAADQGNITAQINLALVAALAGGGVAGEVHAGHGAHEIGNIVYHRLLFQILCRDFRHPQRLLQLALGGYVNRA